MVSKAQCVLVKKIAKGIMCLTTTCCWLETTCIWSKPLSSGCPPSLR